MKKSLTYIIFFDLLFVLLLSLSGVYGGIFSEVLYYLAFILPIGMAFAVAKRGEVVFSPLKLKISSVNFGLTLPLVLPTLALIFLVSWLTSLVMSYFGGSSTTDVSGNILLVIFTHAFLTAALEEVLFRYIPLAYLLPHSKRWSVLISALLFSLVHCNLYQSPYAFMAGVVFAVLDIALDSVVPSFTIHLVNNLASIFWLRYAGCGNFAVVYIAVLVTTALLSLIPIFLMRKKYGERIASAFDKSER